MNCGLQSGECMDLISMHNQPNKDIQPKPPKTEVSCMYGIPFHSSHPLSTFLFTSFNMLHISLTLWLKKKKYICLK